MRLSVIFLTLFCTAAHSADLFVAVKETKTGRESFFRIDTESFWVTKSKQPATNQPLPDITRYKLEKGNLLVGEHSLTKAENILFQCSLGDTDFVVVRQEHNSLASPLRELTRRASSYDWTATASQ